MRRGDIRLKRPTLQGIAAVARQIARKFHPNKIILFGSHAYGKPTQESDVDLLVVMKTIQRPVEQATAIRQAVDFPFPVDLLVRTQKQIEERLQLSDLFIQEILSQGIVLYKMRMPDNITGNHSEKLLDHIRNFRYYEEIR